MPRMKAKANTFIGKPCPHGHDGLRYLKSRFCVHCVRQKSKIIWAQRGEKWRAHRRAAYATEGGKEYRRGRNLARSYGITIEQYDAMAALQNGRCAICGASESERPVKRLVVDHDHRTDAIRELLCTTCNLGLGGFNDEPENLAKAIDYLRRHRRN